MFIFAKSLGGEHYPIAEMRATTAEETYVIGEALVLSSGTLTKAGQTTKPTFICDEDYVAPATGNRSIKVYPILPQHQYRTAFQTNATGLNEGLTVTLGTDALTITASTGTQQTETATVVGTISTAGNAAVVIASALLDADEELDVAVALNDNAAAIAGKIRTALAANANIIANFLVSGSAATVVLTPILYAADDSTLNISVDNGTGDGACAGITTAATSVSTDAVANTGVATITNKLGTGAVSTEALVRFI